MSRPTCRELFGAFSRIGATAFGGPLAAVAMIQGAAERRGWTEPREFAAALGFMEAIPGPTATEMAIFVGFRQRGRLGGLAAGLGYIWPAFVAMLLLSWAYAAYGVLPAVSGFLAGAAPAAMAVLLWAAWRMGRAAVRGWRDGAVLGLSFLLCRFSGLPVLWCLIAGGASGVLLRGAGPRAALAAVVPWHLLYAAEPAAWAERSPRLWPLLAGALKAGALVYGGGYVIVPFLAQDFVDRLGWLTRQEFLAGVSLGQSTPGPISMTAVFVGFKALGLLGAAVAAAGIFAPCFAALLALLPFYDRIREGETARAFFSGLSAAAVGAVLFSASDLVPAAVPGWGAAAVLAGAAALLRVADPAVVILCGGGAGWLLAAAGAA